MFGNFEQYAQILSIKDFSFILAKRKNTVFQCFFLLLLLFVFYSLLWAYLYVFTKLLLPAADVYVNFLEAVKCQSLVFVINWRLVLFPNQRRQIEVYNKIDLWRIFIILGVWGYRLV